MKYRIEKVEGGGWNTLLNRRRKTYVFSNILTLDVGKYKKTDVL
jgi:hypothetical protein